MAEGMSSRRDSLAGDLVLRNNLPPAEIVEPALQPTAFSADTADIYTNTLCAGSGTLEDPQLCDYCFLSTQQLHDHTMMDLETFDEILAWNMAEDSPVRTLSLLGGEFPLNPNAPAMIRRVYEAGFNVHIVTNGSEEFNQLLYRRDVDVMDILRDPERDNLVAVSLDSRSSLVNDAHRKKGATMQALDTIVNLSSNKVPYRINATVMNVAVSGLTQLYALAEKMNAQAVLVHFPSSVGRGRAIFKQRLVREQLNEVPDMHTWLSVVVGGIVAYKQTKRQREDFDIVCERGYAAAIPLDESDEWTRCDLVTRSSSLQFAPRIGADNRDIPVAACGLNMSKVNTYSAYILRNGDLYERAGKSELHDAGYADAHIGCPFLTSSWKDESRHLQCIYSRVNTNRTE